MAHKKEEGTYHCNEKCLDSSAPGKACLSSKFLNIQESIRARGFLSDPKQHTGSLLINASWHPWTVAHQALYPSPTPGAYSNSRPLSRWCHPTISSSVILFSSHLQSFLTSGSFPVNRLFTSGGQNIGVSASASVLPINTQDWSPLEWTGWISLQSKGLSRVFSNTTV